MGKKQDNPIGYRPPPDVKEFLEEFSKGDRSVNKVITYAIRHLMLNTAEEIEQILYRHWSGNFDDSKKDETKPKGSR